MWFQIYVCCAGPIFDLNLYVPGIFCLQVENWVCCGPNGLISVQIPIKAQRNIKEKSLSQKNLTHFIFNS